MTKIKKDMIPNPGKAQPREAAGKSCLKEKNRFLESDSCLSWVMGTWDLTILFFLILYMFVIFYNKGN